MVSIGYLPKGACAINRQRRIKFKLSEELAKKIIEAFGSCSTVYECNDPKDLIEEAENHDDLRSYVTFLLEVEGIFLERETEVRNYGGLYNDEQLTKKLSDDNSFVANIKIRVWNLLEVEDGKEEV